MVAPVFPGLAPWALLHGPFRAGILVVHVPRAGLSCSTLSGFGAVGGSWGEWWRPFSQGLRPGLSCMALSGLVSRSFHVCNRDRHCAPPPYTSFRATSFS